ncbi:GNAT family N-acetyltransferase [Alteromonadaceae bacterium BrNp21-10]|nr:GNAT family N-acetyltransferase [Alteromonadaceae bacterium BrNp21-10]
MEIQFALDEQQIKDCFEVMVHLRPQYSQSAFVEQVQKQMQQGYQLAFVRHNNRVVAVSGFVIGEKLAWGKHVYIDDLVTDPQARSCGAGKALLDWIVEYGRGQQCQELHLDSGVQRFLAHKFYLREGMKIASHHFSRSL